MCFENLFNVDMKEYVAVTICAFICARSGSYFRGETVSRVEMEARLTKRKQVDSADKGEVTGEMIKSEIELVIHWD